MLMFIVSPKSSENYKSNDEILSLKYPALFKEEVLTCSLGWPQICYPPFSHPWMLRLQVWNAICAANLLPLTLEMDKVSVFICSLTTEILEGTTQPPGDLRLPSYCKFKTKRGPYFVPCHQSWQLSKMKTSHFPLDKKIKMNELFIPKTVNLSHDIYLG